MSAGADTAIQITRRAALATAIGALLACPALAQMLLRDSRGRGSVAADSGDGDTPTTLIPDEYLYDWSRAGVPGGIPDSAGKTVFTTITSTGDSTDRTSAINSAIASCPAGQVVVLGAGTFRCNGQINFTDEQGVVLRGAGSGSTTIDSRSSGSHGVRFGNDSSDYPYPTTGNSVTGSPAAGATDITLSSVSGLSVGLRGAFYLDNDTSLPVVNVDDGTDGRDQAFWTKISAINGTTITIQDPLPFDLPSARNPVFHTNLTAGYAYQCGIEGITIEAQNMTATFGVSFWSADQCYLKDVKVANCSRYCIYVLCSVHCEFRKVYLNGDGVEGSNRAGFLIERSGCCLVEDSIIGNIMPHVEMNFGSAGNVFGYNFFYSPIGEYGIDINHGAHNSYNLCEGNVAYQISSDGYFGSGSHLVCFRNRAHGHNEAAPTDAGGSACFEINRFSRKVAMVENVLGKVWSGSTLRYETTTDPAQEPTIYRLGYPNLGNGDYSGTAQPSVGDFWANWPTSGGGPGGWQERDLDVVTYSLRKKNYCQTSSGIPASEADSNTEPASLYKTSKPSWFNSMNWPAWGTGGSTSFGVADADLQKIPAAYRYFNAGADPA